MKIFGVTLFEPKATALVEKQQTQPIFPVPSFGWVSQIWEPFAGAWQRNIRPKNTNTILAFSAVYACISLIASDISKMCLKLTKHQDDGTWRELTDLDIHGNDIAIPFLRVLRKPNDFQTRVQFIMYWITSKLIHGNSYALKERDRTGRVVSLYMLDPCMVIPLVSESGDVFYQVQRDYLAEIDEGMILPASEIIHDRMVCFWHPLVGVSPIYACGRSALQGLAIQENSEDFFNNMSLPSGVLLAPGKIADETALRVKDKWEKGTGGVNKGRVAVLGDGLKYEPMTMPATDAQLIEQLKWTVEDVARCFHVPPYKLGLNTNVTFSNAGQLDQDYYSQCLQTLIESFEVLMDEGLEVPDGYRTEFDLEGLLRMDPLGQAEANAKAITAGYLAPNEARKGRNLAPATGGDTPYLQQQNYSLAALARRDSQPAPATPAPTPPAPATPPAEAAVRDLADLMTRRLDQFESKLAQRTEEDDAAALADMLIRRFAAAA